MKYKKVSSCHFKTRSTKLFLSNFLIDVYENFIQRCSSLKMSLRNIIHTKITNFDSDIQ